MGKKQTTTMKTIEEKAIEYADRPTTAKTWGMHKRALMDAYSRTD